jgi:predicted HicB family RNase H-like nuclease
VYGVVFFHNELTACLHRRIPVAEKKDTKQTTVRVKPELMRKARFYLDEENKSVQEFLADCLATYVHRREQRQAENRVGTVVSAY